MTGGQEAMSSSLATRTTKNDRLSAVFFCDRRDLNRREDRSAVREKTVLCDRFRRRVRAVARQRDRASLATRTMQYPSFVRQTKEGYCNDIRSVPGRMISLRDEILFGFFAAGELSKKDDIRLRRMKERISYHADAKRLYIMRGISRVYHIALRYIINKYKPAEYNKA